MSGIVGREAELASIHAFIDEVREGPAALVLEGDVGIGKSTLWLAGVEHARTRGLRVLSSRPAEAERSPRSDPRVGESRIARRRSIAFS